MQFNWLRKAAGKSPTNKEQAQAARSAKQRSGDLAEDEALRQLETAGLRLRQRNYRCKLGEIDLIMDDDKTIVFVEVRYRKQSHFGSAAETVTKTKQRKVIHAAEHYLLSQGLGQRIACRFDVVSVSAYQIDWIKSAFDGDVK